jgi:hypothetical protein
MYFVSFHPVSPEEIQKVGGEAESSLSFALEEIFS